MECTHITVTFATKPEAMGLFTCTCHPSKHLRNSVRNRTWSPTGHPVSSLTNHTLLWTRTAQSPDLLPCDFSVIPKNKRCGTFTTVPDKESGPQNALRVNEGESRNTCRDVRTPGHNTAFPHPPLSSAKNPFKTKPIRHQLTTRTAKETEISHPPGQAHHCPISGRFGPNALNNQHH